MIWDKMLDYGIFAFFTVILAFIIYFIYIKIRKQNLNENFRITIFAIVSPLSLIYL